MIEAHGPKLRLLLTLLAVIALLPGCPQPDKVSLNVLRDQLLPILFTPETLAVIGEVPMYQGSLDLADGLAVGDDIGSRLAGVVRGYGNERQVIVGLVVRDCRFPPSPCSAVCRWVSLGPHSSIPSRIPGL